jgi:hypothetical protein
MASDRVRRGAKLAAQLAAAVAGVAVIQYFWYLIVLIGVHFLFLAKPPPRASTLVLVYIVACLPTLIAAVVAVAIVIVRLRRRRARS